MNPLLVTVIIKIGYLGSMRRPHNHYTTIWRNNTSVKGFDEQNDQYNFDLNSIHKETFNIFPTTIRTYTLPFSYNEMYYQFDELKPDLTTMRHNGQKLDLALCTPEDGYIFEKNKQFKPLESLILKCVADYNKETLRYYVNEWKITQSWLSYKGKGQSHETHRHENSLISGILYFHELQDDSENIEDFDKMWKKLPPVDFLRYPNYSESMIHVPKDDEGIVPLNYKPGTLILFPSTLYHKVDVNKTIILRKSLSINVIPTHGFGEMGNMTELLF